MKAPDRSELARARVLLVGMGGLGCPAALALVRAGVKRLGLCDDDEVELGNLHRQILFGEGDVGRTKLDAAAQALRSVASDLALRLHPTRLLPHDAVERVGEYDLVLEGSDNFATKFLAADACALARVPVVHAAAVRWVGTALAVGARGMPCYRCLFEDVLAAGVDAPSCAEAGVMGPVVGVVAAAQVDLALALLGGRDVAGQLVTFDGRSESLRRRTLPPRRDCPLCGDAPRIRRIEPEAYASAAPPS
jgi:molybdopterin/thiamine biosynthesis adenylyltransferase